jgi:hypothetical protein
MLVDNSKASTGGKFASLLRESETVMCGNLIDHFTMAMSLSVGLPNDYEGDADLLTGRLPHMVLRH